MKQAAIYACAGHVAAVPESGLRLMGIDLSVEPTVVSLRMLDAVGSAAIDALGRSRTMSIEEATQFFNYREVAKRHERLMQVFVDHGVAKSTKSVQQSLALCRVFCEGSYYMVRVCNKDGNGWREIETEGIFFWTGKKPREFGDAILRALAAAAES